ncbi:hypothetical protein AB9N12_16405 [Bacteroides sp. AN502(2024)]|uniref:hypothetical protein n=1 Tax=Bacteroides sp. AN502(2024) TaxID=3160599 RepID=UPI003516E540
MNYTVFTNTFYWLGIFWILILGVYLTSGIKYKYGLSVYSVAFILACIFALYIGALKAKKRPLLVFDINKTSVNVKKYIVWGIVGVLVFSYDYIRLNGIATSKGESNISLLGGWGALFIPLLLVFGLYLNARKIRNYGKFSIIGVVLIFLYSVPCMINAGREAILFGVIGVLSLYGYNNLLIAREEKKTGSFHKFFITIGSFFTILFFGYAILEISSTRFSDNEINVLLTYKDVSSQAMAEAVNWGPLEFLYYNIASYFSHQIPFIDFTLKEYHGPYLFGMYELNIISRRLPDFLGLDYKLATSELHRLYVSCGESFSGAWNTVLGSFIIDFTWVGAIIACYGCGYVVSISQRKFVSTLDPRYATLVALLCLSTFSTIQLGPFFQTQIYGAYIWWYVIFRKDECNILEHG